MMTTKETLDRIADELKQANKIFVAAHIMPDGDCIGSLLALGWALRELGKTVTLALDDKLGETFNYLPGYNEIAARLPGAEDIFV